MTSEDIQQLFAKTLEGAYDDDEPWRAVVELCTTGTREVLDEAATWCQSPDPLRRARGADVIGQVGNTSQHPGNSFPEETFAVLSRMLDEESEMSPMSSAISALGHLRVSSAIPLILRYESHTDAEVRLAVASALGSYSNDPQAIPALAKLTGDPDGEVRDWATFGLGVLGDTDTMEIREALAARLDDANEDVREEAVVGLAKRRDRRVVPALCEMLRQPERTSRVHEAAALMLGIDQREPELTAEEYLDQIEKTFT